MENEDKDKLDNEQEYPEVRQAVVDVLNLLSSWMEHLYLHSLDDPENPLLLEPETNEKPNKKEIFGFDYDQLDLKDKLLVDQTMRALIGSITSGLFEEYVYSDLKEIIDKNHNHVCEDCKNKEEEKGN